MTDSVTIKKADDRRNDLIAACGLIFIILCLFSGNLITRTYPIDPFWVEIALVHMPVKTFYAHCVAIGHLPLWCPNVAFGYPDAANPHGYLYYIPAWLLMLNFVRAMPAYLIFHLCVLALSGYRLMRYFRARPEGAFVGSICLVLGGYVFTNLGFVPVLSTFAWSPAVIYFVARLLKEVRIRWVILLGLLMTLQFTAGDQETICYQWISIAVAVLLVGLFDKNKMTLNWNTFFAISGAWAIGGILAGVQFIPLAELFRNSERASGWQLVSLKGKSLWILKEYIMWAIRLVFPAPTMAHYFNLGFIALAFGVIGWKKLSKPHRWALGLLMAFLFISAVPQVSPFQRLLGHLPVLKGFRFPWRLLFFLQLTICVLCSWGVDLFLSGFSERKRLPMWVPAWALAYGGVSLFMVMTSNKPWLAPALIIAVGLVTLILRFSGKAIDRRMVLGLVVALIIVDQFVPSVRLLPRSPSNVMDPYPQVARLFKENQSGPYAYSRSIIFADQLDGRFVTGPEAAWGGYTPAFTYSIYLRRAAKFFQMMIPESLDYDPNTGALTKVHPFYLYFYQNEFLDASTLQWFDLIGLRYILVRGDNKKYADFPTFGPDSHFERTQTGEVAIFENKSAFTRAFLTSSAQVFNNSSDVFAFMRSHPDLDYRNIAVLEGAGRNVSAISSEPVEQPSPVIQRYLPDYVEITASPKVKSCLVLTDAWLVGWKVYVDGVEQPIIVADGAFRGVMLEAGNRKVEFIFKTSSFRIGLWTTIATALWTMCFGLWRASLKNRIQIIAS